MRLLCRPKKKVQKDVAGSEINGSKPQFQEKTESPQSPQMTLKFGQNSRTVQHEDAKATKNVKKISKRQQLEADKLSSASGKDFRGSGEAVTGSLLMSKMSKKLTGSKFRCTLLKD